MLEQEQEAELQELEKQFFQKLEQYELNVDDYIDRLNEKKRECEELEKKAKENIEELHRQIKRPKH